MTEVTDRNDNDPADADDMVLVAAAHAGRQRLAYHLPDKECRYVERAAPMDSVKRGELSAEWRVCQDCNEHRENDNKSNAGALCPRCGKVTSAPSYHIPSCDGSGANN